MSTKLKAGTATSGAVIDADTTGILELQTGSTPTTAVTVDTSQNVGIGTASPASKLQVSNTAGYATTTITGNSANGGILSFVDSAGVTTQRIVGFGSTAGENTSLRFDTNGSERMRIDSSGQVGIGVTPSAWNSTYFKVLQLGDRGGYVTGATSGYSGAPYFYIGNNGYYDSAFKYTVSNLAAQYVQVGASHQWFYAASGTAGNAISFTQAMTLDGAGSLLVGATTVLTSGDKFEVSINGSVRSLAVNSAGNVYAYSLGTGTVYSNAGVLTSTNPSDSRLKDNITDISWGLNQVNQLRPVSYDLKNDQANQGKQYGFIAQEVQSVMPELVKTFKAEDDVEYLGLDKEGIYATLVKAIQELNAKVTALEAQLGAK